MERNHSQLEWGPTTAEGERVNCWLPPRFHHVSISNLTSTEIGDYSNTIHSKKKKKKKKKNKKKENKDKLKVTEIGRKGK